VLEGGRHGGESSSSGSAARNSHVAVTDPLETPSARSHFRDIKPSAHLERGSSDDDDWVEVGRDGVCYYWNRATGDTVTEKPAALLVLEAPLVSAPPVLPAVAPPFNPALVPVGSIREGPFNYKRDLGDSAWVEVKGDDGDVYLWNRETSDTALSWEETRAPSLLLASEGAWQG
jgi:hypothetical protein